MASGILKRLGGMFTAEQIEPAPLPSTTITKEEKVVKAKKRNERAYERYRGRGGNSKPMSYYIPDTPEEPILKALELKKSRDGVSKSDLVVAGLKHVLSAEIKELKEKGDVTL